MLERITASALLLVSLIHFLPIAGFAGATKLSSLYGVDISDPNLEILMRHRAILFGIVGALFAYAAFQPKLQPFAFLVGFVSVLSFFYLSYAADNVNHAIRKVVIADIIAFAALLIGAISYFYQSRFNPAP